MPVTLSFDARHKLLVAAASNLVSEEDMDVALHLIVSSVIWPPDVDILWDLRQQDFSQITRRQVSSLVRVREKYPQRGYCFAAAVVPNEVAFGMARMHELMSSDLSPSIRVFRDYEIAWQWLVDNQARPRLRDPLATDLALDGKADIKPKR